MALDGDSIRMGWCLNPLCVSSPLSNAWHIIGICYWLCTHIKGVRYVHTVMSSYWGKGTVNFGGRWESFQDNWPSSRLEEWEITWARRRKSEQHVQSRGTWGVMQQRGNREMSSIARLQGEMEKGGEAGNVARVGNGQQIEKELAFLLGI